MQALGLGPRANARILASSTPRLLSLLTLQRRKPGLVEAWKHASHTANKTLVGVLG